jgi:outer membrane protein TolC
MKTSTAQSRTGVPGNGVAGKPAVGWPGWKSAIELLRWRRLRGVLGFALAISAACLPLAAEPLDFRAAIELALKHSGIIRGAEADRTRAVQRYQADRYAYYPTVIFGSGLGYSFGQPIAIAGQAPSIFNVTHNQTLWNPAMRASMKADTADIAATNSDYADHSEQVILDTALIYLELDTTLQRLNAAQAQKQATDRALYIAQQREKEGVAAPIDTKHAELDSARVDLSITTLEANADILRERLALATGQQAEGLSTVTASVPAPPIPQAEQDVPLIALANSSTIRAADERVRSAHQRARSQHLMNHPSIDFAGQYAFFSNTTNNYAAFYKRFSRNNYSFGLSLRIPIFNLSQGALAAAADAEAMKAEADAQNLREQVAAEAVRTQRSVRQLQAQARVSRLEYELAQANVDTVKLEIEQGRAGARDEELARADIANRQITMLGSQFEYLRAQLQLLRQIGNLRNWALGK